MTEDLKIQMPTQGWKQLLGARKEMLGAFDLAKDQAKSHEVETWHGKVAEAKFREWLTNFLPKRFGVTSGYVVSTGLTSADKTPHFDVIIYDQLESPVLWVEGSPDGTDLGASRAIPVEYVKAVLEVKATFSATTVKSAMEHLGDLLPVMRGPDKPSERYKIHLPPEFCCGLVFFDLRQKDANSEMSLSRVNPTEDLRGFFGGMILRGEGHTKDLTGQLTLRLSEKPIQRNFGRPDQSLIDSTISICATVQTADGQHQGAMLSWYETNFSQFGFDLIAIMQGTYEVGRVSSFYGLGAS